MTNSTNNKNTPQLRFPEFSNDDEWEEKTLGELSSKISDGIHSTPIYDDNGEYYFINGNNFIEGKIVIDDKTKKVSQEEYIKHEKELSENTVFLSINGTIGNIATYNNEKVILGKSACYINIKDGLNKNFIIYSLQTNKVKNYFDSELTGSTIKNLSLKSIKETIINSSSTKEQQKIADCLSSLDELIAAQGEKVAALKTHKKALMQQLFPTEGETLPKLRFKEFENDGEWEEKSLGEIAELTSSKRIHLSDYVSNGIPFFRGKEISLLKNQEVIDDILYISEEQYNQIREKYGVPQVGDILITAVGTLGNVYCIENNNRFYFKDGNLIWMKNILEISKFLEIQLDFNYKMVFASAIGSSQKALTIAGLNKLKFRIPLKPEQQKIANCLSSIDEQIAAESERLSALKEHKKGLMQGLFPSITDSREGA